MSDVSAVTKLLLTANEGFTSTVGVTGITSGGATVPLTNVSGLTDGSVFVGIVEPGLTNQQTFTGTVDVAGNQITGVKWTRGTNTAHAAGVTVVDYSTGTAINMITKALAAHANQDGTLKNNAVTTPVIADNAITTSKIVNANVTTAKIADANVTGAKLNITGTTDANGWTKYDFGTFQEYCKAGTTGVTVAGSGWTSYTTSNLPVGMSTVGSNYVTSSAYSADAALSVAIGAAPASTAIVMTLTNKYTGSVTNNISWSVRIRTP